MTKEQLFSDKDLGKIKKNNQFHREEEVNQILHNIHCWCIRLIPIVLVILFLIDLMQPPWAKNLDLVDRLVWLLGGGLLGTLLTKVKQQDSC